MAVIGSRPVMSGICRSINVTSGRCWRKRSSACRPLAFSAARTMSGTSRSARQCPGGIGSRLEPHAAFGPRHVIGYDEETIGFRTTKTQSKEQRCTLTCMTDDLRTPGHLPHSQCLLDASPDALFTVTDDGRVLSWNRGAESMFGFTPQEAIGRRITDLTVLDELSGEASTDLRCALATGAVAVERVRRAKDGALIPVSVVMHRADDELLIAVCERRQ